MKRPPVSTSFGSDNRKYQPQHIHAVHPHAFNEVNEDNKESEREQEPRPRTVVVCHAPNGVEGGDDEDYEQSQANVARVQHGVQIAVVGRRHLLDPAWRINNAGRIGSYEPKGLVSPSKERPTCDLKIYEIPYICTSR
jgi:hypothetical protein